jgi:hypothetical protein
VGARALSVNGLFPAEHRALRELHAVTRQLVGHWTRLGRRLDEDVLLRGAASAGELLEELTDRCREVGIEVYPAAQTVGANAAGLRGVSDLLLERNQALRGAVLDMAHVTIALGYLAALADQRRDASLAGWHRGWETRLRAIEEEARAVAVAAGGDPEGAIEPAGPGAWGRAGHAVANGLGTLGEALDASPVGRAARKLRR